MMREVVRIVVEFSAGIPMGWPSDGNGLGDLRVVEVLLGDEDGVTLDRDHEGGGVLVADDPPELGFATSIPAAHRRRMSPSCQCFTLRWM